MRQLPSAAEAAILIALCFKRKEDEAGKEFPRLRTSELAFQRLTGRRRLDGRFLADLNEALLDYDLLSVLTADAIGVLKASSVKGWPRMTSDRLNEEIRLVRRGQLDFEELAKQLEDEQVGYDDGGDEES
jgi:hypothetical protein